MGEVSVITPTEYGGLPLPGKCKSCGSVSKEKYIDTGTQEQYYGAVLYCNECLAYMASLLGFITSEKAKELQSTCESLHFENVQLIQQVIQLQGVIDGMVSAGYSAPGTDIVELDLVHLDSLTNAESYERTDQLGEGEGETPEPSNDEGMDFIPTNGSREQSSPFAFG